jgi:[acyl-carrier-protein] S-malonyltransferase
VSDVIAILAPGQGAQKPGMLAPWVDDPDSAALLRTFSDAAGMDLAHLGTEADAAVTPSVGDMLVAGHSVGELAGAAVAGVLAPEQAVALAAVRGREMAAACAVEPTSMAAVLGGDEDAVLARLDELDLEPANRNGSGQIVAAGRKDAIDQLAENPPEGARIRPLSVAGAFHTRFMEPAEKALGGWVSEHRGELAPADPRYVLLSDADGGVVTDGGEMLDRLVAQVTKSVRWDACMATMADRGVVAAVELAPGGTLTGMVKRANKGTATVGITTPDDVAKAVELIQEHQQ